MTKIMILFSFMASSLSAAFLFYVKEKVVHLERETKALSSHGRVIARDLVVLESQWNALTRPSRVEGLVDRYFNQSLPLMSKNQITSQPGPMLTQNP